jgi:DNA modification methylase
VPHVAFEHSRGVLYQGNAVDVLRELPEASVHCCVTSPPYWGLRDYGTAQWEGGAADCDHTYNHGTQRQTGDRADRTFTGQAVYKDECRKCGARRVDQQLGLEKTPEEYVGRIVEVFREVKRVLRDDGTLWLNIGDSYSSGGREGHGTRVGYKQSSNRGANDDTSPDRAPMPPGLKPKDLVGIPWALAKALRDPFYSGRVKNEVDRAWLAAIIDAEGCICGFTHQRVDGRVRTGVNITITNSSTALLEHASELWPARLFMHNHHGEGHLGKLETFRWAINGTENRLQFLREIYPYLIAKRKQAILAYSLLLLVRDAKRLGKSEQAAGVREKRDLLVSLLSDANKVRAFDLPDWCSEPPSCMEPGWYLRSEIIWAKPNPMPESVTDRPTKAHEQIFLLAKSQRYYYDAEAIMEPSTAREFRRPHGWADSGDHSAVDWSTKRPSAARGSFNGKTEALAEDGRNAFRAVVDNRNRRSVWTVTSEPFPEAHFATFPQALIKPCILAGCPEGGTVLDPFSGAGTTALVARETSRRFIGVELSAEYNKIAAKRLAQEVLAL